ncbi:MAG: alpha/beta fold hydrolase [Acidimicrobiia bacterium]
MKRLIALMLVLVVVAAACSDDGTTTPEAAATSVATATPDTTLAPTETTPRPPQVVEVSIATADGLTLDATLYPGASDWVVLGHMLPADKTSWAGLAALLQDAGFTVLAYNNRGYGDSDGEREPFDLPTDARAALAFARSEGATRIVYGGASMNGANAMVIGADADLTGIFTLSGVPTFPSAGNAAASVPDIEGSKLFVAAEDDGNAAADAGDYFDAATQPRQVIILERGGHGTNMLLTNPDLGPQILQWIEGAFGA